MKESKKIAVILVNWNGKHDTLTCLKSLELLDTGVHHVNIIVVDNGSTDGSVAAISEKYPEVNIIESSDNTGFTGGNNLGIELALTQSADIVWLLNNDTIVDSHALLPLVDELTKKEIGIVGSKIFFMSGREFHKERYKESEKGKVIWYAGGVIDWKNVYASHKGVDEVDVGQFKDTESTPFVSGCSMAIRRDVLETVGVFDTRYYLYFEDIDLCLRAKRKKYRLHFVPDSIVWHKNAGSSDKPGNPLHNYYLTRNRFLFGFTYASWRTKRALLIEAWRIFTTGTVEQRAAVRDLFLLRFGGRFTWQSQ